MATDDDADDDDDGDKMMMMRMLMLMLMLMLMAMNWPQSYHIIAVATNQNRPLYMACGRMESLCRK